MRGPRLWIVMSSTPGLPPGPAASSAGRDGAERGCSDPPGASSEQRPRVFPHPSPSSFPTSGTPLLLETLQARISKIINTRVYSRGQSHRLPALSLSSLPQENSSFLPCFPPLGGGKSLEAGMRLFSAFLLLPARVLSLLSLSCRRHRWGSPAALLAWIHPPRGSGRGGFLLMLWVPSLFP